MLFAFFAANVNSAKAAEKKMEVVPVTINWHPQAYYVAFCLGKLKNFYEAEGIDLKIETGAGEAITATRVTGEERRFGTLSASFILKQNQKENSIVAVSGIFQRNMMGIYYRKSAGNGIKQPSDLAGKKIYTSPASKAEYLALFLEQMNLREKVKVIYTSGDSLRTDLQLFLLGHTDVVAATCFQDMYEKRSPNPADVGLFCFDDYDSKLITLMLVTSSKTISKNPELVKRFVRATNKSLDYAMRHPEEAARAFLFYYPKLNYEEELRCFKRIIPFILSYDGKLGYMSRQDWEKIERLLLKTGGLRTNVDVSKVYTNKFQ